MCILDFNLFVLLITKMGMLESQVKDLPVVFFNSVRFCFMYFQILLLGVDICRTVRPF